MLISPVHGLPSAPVYRCSNSSCHHMAMGLHNHAPHMETLHHIKGVQGTRYPWTCLQVHQRLQTGHKENEGGGRHSCVGCSQPQLPSTDRTTLPQMEVTVWYIFCLIFFLSHVSLLVFDHCFPLLQTRYVKYKFLEK